MNMSLAKTLFDEGVLKKALVTRDIERGFNLAFSRSEDGSKAEPLDVERGGVRKFKTADAALKMAEQIGFRKVEFHL